MNCKDSEKPGAEPGRPLPCTPLSLPPLIKEESLPPSVGCSRRGEKTTHGGSLKKPTVGRRCDLQWVGKTTYSRFYLESSRECVQIGEYALHSQGRISSRFYQKRAIYCYSLRTTPLFFGASVYSESDKSPLGVLLGCCIWEIMSKFTAVNN